MIAHGYYNEDKIMDNTFLMVFSILRNARALHVGEAPNMVVCWGGHSINENA